MKIARGSYQRSVFNKLLRGDEVHTPQYALGRTNKYIHNYEKSFYQLLKRMEDAGYKIERKPGPRGGEWSATYKLKK